MLIEKGSLILAPMAGVTDYVYRGICTQFGADATVTEMVSAKGFLLTPKERENVMMLRQTGEKEHCALQIFGSDAAFMGEAAKRLSESRFFALDVNMGCPAPKIVSGGDGSAMLKDIHKAEKVIAAVVKNSALPVTVKMRMGWDEEHIVYKDFGRMLEDNGVSAVTLHGRTRNKMYSGKADWEAIGELTSLLHIPVIGNGDVTSVSDGKRMLEETGCHAVMVGRGAMGNPWLFANWKRAKEGLPEIVTTARERIEMAMEHANRLVEHKGDNIGIKEMRKHFAWYLHGLHGSAQARVKFNTAGSLAEMREIAEEYLKTMEE